MYLWQNKTIRHCSDFRHDWKLVVFQQFKIQHRCRDGNQDSCWKGRPSFDCVVGSLCSTSCPLYLVIECWWLMIRSSMLLKSGRKRISLLSQRRMLNWGMTYDNLRALNDYFLTFIFSYAHHSGNWRRMASNALAWVKYWKTHLMEKLLYVFIF